MNIRLEKLGDFISFPTPMKRVPGCDLGWICKVDLCSVPHLAKGCAGVDPVSGHVGLSLLWHTGGSGRFIEKARQVVQDGHDVLSSGRNEIKSARTEALARRWAMARLSAESSEKAESNGYQTGII
ncbi:hypothetical protein [Paracoccus aminophilus]|uniref:hypothetical protein n=1 Tax=Paracoccus aminophilus TaxID=34003 RepID=UPI001F44AC50|nr:hypothetical protein [Paracoccus aminophilus]